MTIYSNDARHDNSFKTDKFKGWLHQYLTSRSSL